MKVKISFFLLVCFSQFLISKPIFKQTPYLIGSMNPSGTGVVGLGGADNASNTYPLALYTVRDGETALSTDFWYIKEESDGLYSFRNAATNQYIKYDFASTDPNKSLLLVDTHADDQSTLFTMKLVQENNLCYYIVQSAVDNSKGWSSSTTEVGGFYPIIGDGLTASSNQNFMFYSVSGDAVTDDTKLSVVLPTATQNLGSFKTYFNSLTFSYKVPIVNSAKNEMYLSIPESQMNSSVSMTINYLFKNQSYKLYIDNTLIQNGTDYTFTDIVALKTYKIDVRDDATTLISGTINFSSLPLVQIYSDVSISSVYTLNRLVVTEPEALIPTDIDLSEIKVRGATSSGFPKKSYSIKLKNPVDGLTPIYKSFVGLRSDNNWVLDAMYIDPARMRNRVSTDLWNDFSTPPYYKVDEPNMINGTRGKFVEVFLNDSYIGLYCLTEKVDRKQLNLKKFQVDATTGAVTQRGALYKAAQWSGATLLGNTKYSSVNWYYDNDSETWDAWEVKYPDLGDGEQISWKPLYYAVYCTSSYITNSMFTSKVSQYYDLPVFMDYYLLIELLLATDNHGKNVFMSNYDQSVTNKMTLTPWDLDGTWGRRWDGSSTYTSAKQDFPTFINKYEHMENNLYIRLRELNYDNYSSKLANRYRELRDNYFNYDSIMKRFTDYRAKYKLSGADVRERNKWPIKALLYTEISFDQEIAFLSTWIKARLEYLDKQYLGGPFVASVSKPLVEQFIIYPRVVTDNFNVSKLQYGQYIEIYSLQGLLLKRFLINNTDMNIDISDLTTGVYIVKSGGASSKIIKK